MLQFNIIPNAKQAVYEVFGLTPERTDELGAAFEPALEDIFTNGIVKAVRGVIDPLDAMYAEHGRILINKVRPKIEYNTTYEEFDAINKIAKTPQEQGFLLVRLGFIQAEMGSKVFQIVVADVFSIIRAKFGQDVLDSIQKHAEMVAAVRSVEQNRKKL